MWVGTCRGCLGLAGWCLSLGTCARRAPAGVASLWVRVISLGDMEEGKMADALVCEHAVNVCEHAVTSTRGVGFSLLACFRSVPRVGGQHGALLAYWLLLLLDEKY